MLVLVLSAHTAKQLPAGTVCEGGLSHRGMGRGCGPGGWRWHVRALGSFSGPELWCGGMSSVHVGLWCARPQGLRHDAPPVRSRRCGWTPVERTLRLRRTPPRPHPQWHPPSLQGIALDGPGSVEALLQQTGTARCLLGAGPPAPSGDVAAAAFLFGVGACIASTAPQLIPPTALGTLCRELASALRFDLVSEALATAGSDRIVEAVECMRLGSIEQVALVSHVASASHLCHVDLACAAPPKEFLNSCMAMPVTRAGSAILVSASAHEVLRSQIALPGVLLEFVCIRMHSTLPFPGGLRFLWVQDVSSFSTTTSLVMRVFVPSA